MNSGVYIANVDLLAKKADLLHIDQEFIELERLNRATQERLQQEAQIKRRQEKANARKKRMRLRLGRYITNCVVVCVGIGLCAWHGLASWYLALPVMVMCLVAGAWRLGRGCR